LGANPAVPLNFAWPQSISSIQPSSDHRVIYFPFASAESKCWPKESFVALISDLSRRYPAMKHTVLGGIRESESVAQWGPLFKGLSNVECQSALPLESTIAMVRASRLVVSNDTGIRNLAIALDCPTVGIFFSTVPYRYWPRYGVHDAVFEPDGTVPSIDSVCRAVSRVLGPAS